MVEKEQDLSFGMPDSLLLSLMDYEPVEPKRNQKLKTSRKMEVDKSFVKNLVSPEVVKLQEKYLEISRKQRATQSELVCTRERNKQLASKIASLEKEQIDKLNTPTINDQDMHNLQDRLRQSIQQLTTCRNSNSLLAKELKQAIKSLEQETGETIPNIGAWLVKTSTGWKGRQQQILSLTTKLRRLENELKKFVPRHVDTCNYSTSGATKLGYELLEEEIYLENTPFELISSCPQLPGASTQASGKFEIENKQLMEEIGQLKSGIRAKKARIVVLTAEVQEIRDKSKLLAEKGEHDNHLVKTLLQRNESLTLSLDTIKSQAHEKEHKLNKNIEQLTGEKIKAEQLVKSFKVIVEQKEEIINTLKQQLPESEDGSRNENNHQPASIDDDDRKFRALSVECDHLRKLCQDLETRCDQYVKDGVQKDQEISEFRRKVVVLDAKLESLQVRKKDPVSLAKKVGRLDESRLKDPSLGEELTSGLQSATAKRLVQAVHALQSNWIVAQDKTESLVTALDKLEEARRHDNCLFNKLIHAIHAEYKESER